MRLEAFVVLLGETVDVYAEWKRLVVALGVTGVKVHDASLVAAMKVHGVGRILTFNGQDFERYPGIEIVTPAQLSRRRAGDTLGCNLDPVPSALSGRTRAFAHAARPTQRRPPAYLLHSIPWCSSSASFASLPG